MAALSSLSSLTLGDYTLMTAAGGLGGSAFTLASPTITVGSNIYSLSLANSTPSAEILTITGSAAPLDSTWTKNGAGNWGDANWSAGEPNAAGTKARFTGSTTAGTVTLEAAKTVGQVFLAQGAGSTSYTLAGTALTLDNTGGSGGEALDRRHDR